jgi:hypothetical protein
MECLLELYPARPRALCSDHLPPASDVVKNAAFPPLPLTPSWPDLYLYLDMNNADVRKLMVRILVRTSIAEFTEICVRISFKLLSDFGIWRICTDWGSRNINVNTAVDVSCTPQCHVTRMLCYSRLRDG